MNETTIMSRPYDDIEQLANIACMLKQGMGGNQAEEVATLILSKIKAIVETIDTTPAAE